MEMVKEISQYLTAEPAILCSSYNAVNEGMFNHSRERLEVGDPLIAIKASGSYRHPSIDVMFPWQNQIFVNRIHFQQECCFQCA